jgi:drug/metabolite transporter (DMT)-like permease
LFGAFTSGAIISLVCTLGLQQHWTNASWIGIAMGVFSSLANDAVMRGFAVGKPSIVALLTSLPPVVVVIIAFLLWQETLTFSQLGAFAIIIFGLMLIRYSNELRSGNWQGAQWGALAMLCYGLNDVASKMSTKLNADLFPTLFLMFTVGATYFAWNRLLLRCRKRRPSIPYATSTWRTIGIGMGVGVTNMVGMIFIMSAFQTGITGLVSAVASTNVLIILFYTWFFHQEQFRRMQWIGMGTAFVGVLLLQLM